jgi:hypothetical protein
MLLQEYDYGMIVTTAPRFSRAAQEAAEPRTEHLASQRVHLIDCRRLLDAMNLLKVEPEATKHFPAS